MAGILAELSVWGAIFLVVAAIWEASPLWTSRSIDRLKK